MRSIFYPAHSRRLRITFWDFVAAPLFLFLFVLFALSAKGMFAPLQTMQSTPISLDPAYLPGYALRTTLRLFLALIPSMLFTLVVGTLAAKSRRAEQFVMPLLDILQSVPVLGYISFTVTAFLTLFPGSMFGVECAALFAVFTGQVWNMTFSLYQSLKSLPNELSEASAVFRLTVWQKFWRVELPFAAPGLLWNTMMSMSGGWFFIVASEAITVGDKEFTLPGVGSYVNLAILQRDLGAVGWAVLAMAVVIVLYDQLFFRPLVAWADKFKYELSAGVRPPSSWFLNLLKRAGLLKQVSGRIGSIAGRFMMLRLGPLCAVDAGEPRPTSSGDRVFQVVAALAALGGAYGVFLFIDASVGWDEVGKTFILGMYTGLRVLALIVLSCLIWTPVGVAVGLRPKLAETVQTLAQFLSAFPANLIYPVAVVAIVTWGLNSEIWVTAVMMLGAQWYIMFNVIAGAAAIPNDLLEACGVFRIKGWIWWRRVVIPAIFPYLITGALTAWGGVWNASIVAEYMTWGRDEVQADGLGYYIAYYTDKGDFAKIALGVGMMSLIVVLVNRFGWRRLYEISADKLRMG